MPGTKVSPGWQSKESTLLGTYLWPRGGTKGSRFKKALECSVSPRSRQRNCKSGQASHPQEALLSSFKLAKLVALRGGSAHTHGRPVPW